MRPTCARGWCDSQNMIRLVPCTTHAPWSVICHDSQSVLLHNPWVMIVRLIHKRVIAWWIMRPIRHGDVHDLYKQYSTDDVICMMIDPCVVMQSFVHHNVTVHVYCDHMWSVLYGAICVSWLCDPHGVNHMIKLIGFISITWRDLHVIQSIHYHHTDPCIMSKWCSCNAAVQSTHHEIQSVTINLA